MNDYSEINADQIQSALQIIEEHGLVLDEHATFVGSPDIERNHLNVEAILRKHGYQGGRLAPVGKYFTCCGAVYALYDTERHTRESALEFIDEHTKRSFPWT
jgi:hypothetical protein